MEITPTTELEAVNTMLGAVGEMPVSTLDDIGNSDVNNALVTLLGISREVQSKGLWFNTDNQFVFTVNDEGRIALPAQILSIRPVAGRGTARLTHRNGFIYNLSGSTDVFDPESPPSAKVIWMYDFERLPETARRYISIRAARIFQKNFLGSESLNGFTQQHEDEASALFRDEAFDFEYAEGANFFNDDSDTSLIAGGAGGE